MRRAPSMVVALAFTASCVPRPEMSNATPSPPERGPPRDAGRSGVASPEPAPPATPDAGRTAEEVASETPEIGWPTVVCDVLDAGCRFGGVVREIHAAVRKVSRLPLRYRGVVTVFDDAPGLDCERAEILDARVDPIEGPTRRAEAPRRTSEIFITLPARTALPFAVGDRLCGSVEVLRCGYDPCVQVLVARATGEALIAFGDALPRGPSPIRGFRFALGAMTTRKRQFEGYWYMDHEMLVTHGALTRRVPSSEPVELRGGPDGDYWIRAYGYTTAGRLPRWMTWEKTSGYAFAVVRIGP